MKKDLRFLERFNLMDYSLLLAIEEKAVENPYILSSRSAKKMFDLEMARFEM